MKTILKPLCLLIFVLPILMIGCSKSDPQSVQTMNRAEQMLLKDSLPDTARMMLERIEATALSEHDRGRLAVLTAMARYKSYVPIGPDSLLQMAVRMFEDRGDSLEYLSCLYTGIANSETEQYERAFMNLRRAEDVALADSNFYIAALAQRAQCHIYQKFYIGKDEYEKACQAGENFKKAGKPRHAKLMITDRASALNAMHRPKEAIALLEASLADSTDLEAGYKARCNYILSFSYELTYNPEAALACLLKSGYFKPENISHLLRMARLQASCNDLENAEQCLARTEGKIQTRNDSINYYFILSDISRKKGDYKQAYHNMKNVYNMYSYDLEVSSTMPFDDFADKYYKDMAEKNLLLAQRQKQINSLWLWLSVFLLLTAGVFVLFVRKRNRLVNDQMALDIMRLNDAIAEARSEIERLNEKSGETPDMRHQNLVSEYKSIDALYHKWLEINTMCKTPSQRLESVKSVLEYLGTDEKFKDLEAYINSKSDGLIQLIRSNYPRLSEMLIRVAIMSYLHLSANSIANILNTSVNAVYTAKNRLKKAIEADKAVGQRISAELFS